MRPLFAMESPTTRLTLPLASLAGLVSLLFASGATTVTAAAAGKAWGPSTARSDSLRSTLTCWRCRSTPHPLSGLSTALPTFALNRGWMRSPQQPARHIGDDELNFSSSFRRAACALFLRPPRIAGKKKDTNNISPRSHFFFLCSPASTRPEVSRQFI